MTKDMTKGSPIKLLVLFALPVLAGGILQHCYSLADGAIVGRYLGVGALAAIGATANLDGLLLGFVMALMQGFSILVAQRFGARDQQGLLRAAINSLYLTLIIAALMTAISLPLIRPLLRLLRTPDEVVGDAQRYIGWIFACMVVPMLTNLAYALLRAMGDSRTPLICLISSFILNIGFDVLLIIGMGLGVAGAAMGTIIAQLLVWPVLLLRLRREKALAARSQDWKPCYKTMMALMKLGLPMAIQNSIALVGVILLQVVVNGFGVKHMAAFTAVTRILYFIKEPAVSYGHAVSAYVGQNYGARRYDRVLSGVRVSERAMAGVCAACMIATHLFSAQLIGLLIPAGDPETRILAGQVLRILVWSLPALYMMYLYRPALQGTGDTLTPMASGGVEMVLRSALALTVPGITGFAGVGIAEVSAWIGAAVLLVIAYQRVKGRLRRERAPAQYTA